MNKNERKKRILITKPGLVLQIVEIEFFSVEAFFLKELIQQKHRPTP